MVARLGQMSDVAMSTQLSGVGECSTDARRVMTAGGEKATRVGFSAELKDCG